MRFYYTDFARCNGSSVTNLSHSAKVATLISQKIKENHFTVHCLVGYKLESLCSNKPKYGQENEEESGIFLITDNKDGYTGLC